MNFIAKKIFLLLFFTNFAFSQTNLKKVEINKCLSYNFSDDLFIETPNDYYTYALKINYINSEENQDEDQGHTFSFKVQLHGDIINNFAEGTYCDKDCCIDNGCKIHSSKWFIKNFGNK